MKAQSGSSGRGGSSQILVGIIQLLRLLDWVTELLKLLCNEPVARPYWGWVVLTMCTSSYLLAQRLFDQVYLVMRAAKWQDCTRCCLCVLFLPLAIVATPVSSATLALHNMRVPKEKRDADLQIFAQRPLSTLTLGLPAYGVASAFQGDPALVMHPLQAQMRSMQSLYQFLLEDMVCFVVDPLVIFNAEEGADVLFFWISLIFSIAFSLILCVFTVKEVDWLEREKTASGTGEVLAIRGGPYAPQL